ncbi:hypothetical protein BDW27_113127 [Nocardiopsis sp. L17-MgMaSL7]|nr:hypothetical protein BDW27_113127 [Nocardiopsis sp. L17-MgMaSL7]
MALRTRPSAELVLHAVAVRLVDGAALAGAHIAGELVAGLLHGELTVHLPAIGVVDRVDHAEQVVVEQRLRALDFPARLPSAP